MFVRLVVRLNGLTWQECHIEAFAFLGAVPRRIVLDNLKDGVIKPDLYDPKLNPSYAELAAHYGFLIDPARKGHPKDSRAWSGHIALCGIASGADGGF